MPKARFVVLLAGALLVSACVSSKNPAPEYNEDGLKRLESKQLDQWFVRDGVDLSQYKKLLLDEPRISFKDTWVRDYSHHPYYVSRRDREKIKTATADLLKDSFKTVLQAQEGYQWVTEPGQGVLVVKADLEDLYINAPDSLSQPFSLKVYTRSVGAAALNLRLYDSLSGQLLASAYDHRQARDNLHFERTTRLDNIREARFLFRHWAGLLAEHLHGPAK